MRPLGREGIFVDRDRLVDGVIGGQVFALAFELAVESWQRTDADGLGAEDRAEQVEMNREAIAEERADRLFG